MFTLGTLIEGDERILHHPRFDIDERAMPIGVAVLAEAVLKFSYTSGIFLRISPEIGSGRNAQSIQLLKQETLTL